MSSTDSRGSKTQQHKIRRDGWTPERQLRFLKALERTRSVTNAARAADMSRESAYRLRNRAGNALFAAAWDKALQPRKFEVRKTGAGSLLTRRSRIAKLLGNPPKVTKLAKFLSPRFDPLRQKPV